MRGIKRVEAPASPITLLEISIEMHDKLSRYFMGSKIFDAPTVSIELLSY